MLNQVEYYAHPAVRRRIAEYCGGDPDHSAGMTAEYLVGFGECLLWDGRAEPFLSVDTSRFHELLDRGLDVFRSNWDAVATLGVLDIEYFNNDYPGEIYLRPQRCFALLEPVRLAVRAVFSEYGIPFLEIMTGQGYHFTTRVLRNSAADEGLIRIGRVRDTLAGKYAHPTGRRKRRVSIFHGRSFDGMGRLMEFVAHQVIRRARDRSRLPIVTTDVAVGPGRCGREAVSIDLSMYADPIHMRDIRTAFSTHQKHKVFREKVGRGIADGTPVQTCFPTGSMTLYERLRMRRHFRWTAEWAQSCGPMTIPVGNAGILRLLRAYRSSRLYRFHREFDSVDHDHWTRWSETYDRFDLSRIPPCVREILLRPNPNILKPTNIQTLVRVLLSLGWHPKHVAGLIRSKLERDYGWTEDWTKYDAGSRADFYVRLFAGQLRCGLDGLADHNCVSHQEKGYCVESWCGYSLGNYR